MPNQSDGLSLFFPNGFSLATGDYASPLAPGGDPRGILISSDGRTITGQFWIAVCPGSGIYQGFSWSLHGTQ